MLYELCHIHLLPLEPWLLTVSQLSNTDVYYSENAFVSAVQIHTCIMWSVYYACSVSRQITAWTLRQDLFIHSLSSFLLVRDLQATQKHNHYYKVSFMSALVWDYSQRLRVRDCTAARTIIVLAEGLHVLHIPSTTQFGAVQQPEPSLQSHHPSTIPKSAPEVYTS